MSVTLADPISSPLLARLATLMRAAGREALHGAGCACCGRGPVHIVPAAVELDLLGFLAAHYRQDGEERLMNLLERWSAHPEPGLISRLSGGLPDDPPGPTRARILADLLAILDVARAGLPVGRRT